MSRSNDDVPLRWEDAAKKITVEGWACIQCGAFYGNAETSERSARYCCHTDSPCESEGCTNRRTRHLVCCESCYHKRKVARYDNEIAQAEDRRAPSNLCPLACLDGDKYFFDLDSLFDHCEEHELKPSDLFLVYCKPHDPNPFDLSEYLSDYLPEDGCCSLPNHDDAEAVENAVNKYLDANRPFSWYPDHKRRPTNEMIAEWDAAFAEEARP